MPLTPKTPIEKIIITVIVFTLLTLIMGFAADDCETSAPKAKNRKEVQEQQAQRKANSLRFTENAEQDNIVARLKLTSKPGLIGYVLLINEAGQPIYYTTVKGKITSGQKRLTKPYRRIDCDKGQFMGDCMVKSPSDEGTHGSSSPYIYFWTQNDQYFQWNGKYLYSDQPFRLTVKPLVVDIPGGLKK